MAQKPPYPNDARAQAHAAMAAEMAAARELSLATAAAVALVLGGMDATDSRVATLRRLDSAINAMSAK